MESFRLIRDMGLYSSNATMPPIILAMILLLQQFKLHRQGHQAFPCRGWHRIIPAFADTLRKAPTRLLPTPATMRNSAMRARVALINAVRWRTNGCRLQCKASTDWRSGVLVGTKHMFGRVIVPSQLSLRPDKYARDKLSENNKTCAHGYSH